MNDKRVSSDESYIKVSSVSFLNEIDCCHFLHYKLYPKLYCNGTEAYCTEKFKVWLVSLSVKFKARAEL